MFSSRGTAADNTFDRSTCKSVELIESAFIVFSSKIGFSFHVSTLTHSDTDCTTYLSYSSLTVLNVYRLLCKTKPTTLWSVLFLVAGPGIEPGSGGYEPPEVPLLYPAMCFLPLVVRDTIHHFYNCFNYSIPNSLNTLIYREMVSSAIRCVTTKSAPS